MVEKVEGKVFYLSTFTKVGEIPRTAPHKGAMNTVMNIKIQLEFILRLAARLDQPAAVSRLLPPVRSNARAGWRGHGVEAAEAGAADRGLYPGIRPLPVVWDTWPAAESGDWDGVPILILTESRMSSS